MNSKSTGPRTPQGKARSAQNAIKHGICVPRVLLEEEETASILSEGIRKEFCLKGPMELMVCRRLVQVELEAERLEKFACSQVKKSEMLGKLDFDQFPLTLTPAIRYPIPEGKEAQDGFLPRMRPPLCVIFLKNLKKSIENQGLSPARDLDCLRSIYGNQMTTMAELINLRYKMFMIAEEHDKAKEKGPVQQTVDYKAQILEGIEGELEWQERQQLRGKWVELMTCAADQVVLPPDHIQDRVERLRTAIDRRRSRALGDLDTIRRLKGDL